MVTPPNAFDTSLTIKTEALCDLMRMILNMNNFPFDDKKYHPANNTSLIPLEKKPQFVTPRRRKAVPFKILDKIIQ